jgi:mono/diheme cytochrome c family protein
MRTLLITVLLMGSASFAAQAADAKAGQAVYDKHCQSCHGPNGAAPPNVAKFADGRITDLRSSRVQTLSDADLGKIITNGVKDKMRGDTTVSGKDMEDLLAFVRSLKS